jgi:hypothetical protein
MEGFDFSNSFDFIQKDIDVVFLFPRIPIDLALQYMNE